MSFFVDLNQGLVLTVMPLARFAPLFLSIVASPAWTQTEALVMPSASLLYDWGAVQAGRSVSRVNVPSGRIRGQHAGLNSRVIDVSWTRSFGVGQR